MIKDTQTIYIEQAHDVDEDGELGGLQQSWWAEGHHETEPFVRALVDYAIENGDDTIPRIDLGLVRHVWRRHRHLGDSWIFDDQPEIPAHARRKDWRPVTTYDAEHRRGARQCAVRECGSAADVRVPLGIRWALDGMAISDRTVDVALCRTHREELDMVKHWRTLVVPVGATLVLPKADGDAAPTAND